jgi:hypothetical protein
MSLSNINSSPSQLSTQLSANQAKAKAKAALPQDLPTQISNIQKHSAIQRMQTMMPGNSLAALDTTGKGANNNQATVNNANVASASTNINHNQQSDKVSKTSSNAVLSFKSLKKAADPSKNGQRLSATKQNSQSKNTKPESEEDTSNNFFKGVIDFFQ